MQVQSHVNLRDHNTFGANISARYWASVGRVEDLCDAIAHHRLPEAPRCILGGGSNILFTCDLESLVLHNAIQGLSILEETDRHVVVLAGGGMIWHDFVQHCVAQGWGGVENLSLIPGTVGAAPIQNIGAYGVELKDTFEWLEAIDLATGEVGRFYAADCAFGYRDSIFKRSHKGKVFIARVAFRLTKGVHRLSTSYGAISQTLEALGIESPSIADISRAVVRIRQSKLPDPRELGNCGSFFKNPEIPEAQYTTLCQRYPDMPGYPTAGGWVKVPAGWLIEQCGWKGKRVGNVGAYAKQALVIVNYGGASGEEAWGLAQQIQASVFRQFGIAIIPEVNIAGPHC